MSLPGFCFRTPSPAARHAVRDAALWLSKQEAESVQQREAYGRIEKALDDAMVSGFTVNIEHDDLRALEFVFEMLYVGSGLSATPADVVAWCRAMLATVQKHREVSVIDHIRKIPTDEGNPSDYDLRIPKMVYAKVVGSAELLVKAVYRSPTDSAVAARVRDAIVGSADAGTYRLAFFQREDLQIVALVLRTTMRELSPFDEQAPPTPGESWCATAIEDLVAESAKDPITKLGEIE